MFLAVVIATVQNLIINVHRLGKHEIEFPASPASAPTGEFCNSCVQPS